MSAKLPPVPFRERMQDNFGYLVPVWSDWFKQAFVRMGGNIAASNDEEITTARIADGAVSFVKLLSTDWTSSKVASGYQKLASGLYVQWGATASLGSGTTTGITFPTAFPTGCLQVVAGITGNAAAATTATGQWGTGNYSASGFDLYNRTSIAHTFNWMGIGY